MLIKDWLNIIGQQDSDDMNYLNSKECDEDEERKMEKRFIFACGQRDMNTVKECIEKGVDVNASFGDSFGLQKAAKKNYPEICELLLSQPNIDVNKSVGPNFPTAFHIGK